MENALLVVLLLLNAGVVGVGIYLSAYLKKKAQNLATREEFEELQRQTETLTRTTAKIEAEIKGDLWDRQKRWELRRDVTLEAARAMATLKDSLTNLHAVYTTEKRAAEQGKPERVEKKTEVYTAFNNAADKFWRTTTLVAIACGQKTARPLLQFAQLTNTIGTEITEGKPEELINRARELIEKYDAVLESMRSEMKLDEK
jgi:hypothetical protein